MICRVPKKNFIKFSKGTPSYCPFFFLSILGVPLLTFKEFSDKVGGPIQPGMIIQASIIGDKRTVLGYIFSPVTKLQSRAFREK